MVELPDGFWDHQRGAIEAIDRYLSSDQTSESALITMPTGTGKTGVLSGATSIVNAQGHNLVLTPWDALVRQLIRELSGRFWQRLEIDAPPSMPSVRRLPSSTDYRKLAEASEPTTFVGTISAISVMNRRALELGYQISDLFESFGQVLVDEGHYEPAHGWSQSIRSLNRPTVLLTATPYRNDRKFFNIGEHRFRLRHHEAEDLGLLRKPEFHRLDAGTPEAFARALTRFVADLFSDDADARVIVRCGHRDSVRRLVAAIRRIDTRVIGIHETFGPEEDGLVRRVPEDDPGARYWVHQNKLIEGIDDPRFKILAFFDTMSSDRAVVQQIGRVLRNPGRDPNEARALVIGRGDRDLASLWERYMGFDRQPVADSAATMPELTDRLLKSQPEAFYLDGAFRTLVNLHDPQMWNDIRFRLRTRIYRRRPNTQVIDISELSEAITAEWSERDRATYRIQPPNESTVLIPYVTSETSPLLRTSTFIEPRFGYTFIMLLDDLLFYFDTQGATPRALGTHYRALEPERLQSLFPDGPSQITRVSLLNTDTGSQAARSRSVRAASIDALAPELSDYAYICSIAEGYTEVADNRFRRYVGLTRARVTDHVATEGTYADYLNWLASLADQIRSAGRSSPTLARYAARVETPDEPEPVHLLLDLDTEFVRQDGTREIPMEAGPYSSDLTNRGATIWVNGTEHPVDMAWVEAQQSYRLSSPSLQAEGFFEHNGERGLISYINEEQAFRIVPKSGDSLYSHGAFYRPVIPSRRHGEFQLLDILTPVQELELVESEKGQHIVDDDWDPRSVFGLISAIAPDSSHSAPTAMADLLQEPDLLVCTDRGTELADFVAVNHSRVALIHAKASNPPHKRSAAALQTVVGQAIKNLPYLQPLSNDRPSTRTWSNRWKMDGANEYTRRLRVGEFANGSEMWGRIRQAVSSPSCEREVWLVLGRTLSVSELDNARRRGTPPPEILQIYALLQTAWGAVSQLGARLRVFCSP